MHQGKDGLYRQSDGTRSTASRSNTFTTSYSTKQNLRRPKLLVAGNNFKKIIQKTQAFLTHILARLCVQDNLLGSLDNLAHIIWCKDYMFWKACAKNAIEHNLIDCVHVYNIKNCLVRIELVSISAFNL